MSKIPTPHIAAAKDEIAKTVLMPGDPLRAKYIAEHFLENATCVTSVRNMLGYTGEYKGSRLTVMGSGMGIPSAGIYTYELFHFYDVDTIIRIGSAGSISEKADLRDIVIGVGASTDSSYLNQYHLPGQFAPIADFNLCRKAVEAGERLGIRTVAGNILSSEVFYNDDASDNEKWRKMGILAIEMESAAIYANAARAGKKAVCILTISDNLLEGTSLSAKDRQNSFTDMMQIALEIGKE